MKEDIKFVNGNIRERKWYHKVLDFMLPIAKGSFYYHPKIKEPFVLYPDTGLRDKNGRQIFLNDIIKRANGIKHA